MKKIIGLSMLRFIALFTILLPIVACGKKDEDEPENIVAAPFEVTSGNLNIEAPQSYSSYPFTVKTTGTWKVIRKSYQKWAEARPIKGTGDGSFSIIVSENKSGVDRSMTFAFYVDGEEQEEKITLTQTASGLIWEHTGQDENPTITEGVSGYNVSNMTYRKDGNDVLSIVLGEPVMVSRSESDDNISWGYYQFPTLAQSEDGRTLLVSWSNAPDDEKYFGQGSTVTKSNRRYSTDNGATWNDAIADNVSVRDDGYCSVRLANRDIVYVNTPATRDLRDENLKKLMPQPIEHRHNLRFYRVSELPDTLKGTDVTIWHASTNKTEKVKATINDEGSLRFSIESGYEYFPIKWWGDLRLLGNNDIAAVMYYTSYETASGNADPALSCSCYISSDGGYSWNRQGKIPYVYDQVKDPYGPTRWYYGYSEPTFEILPDGSWYVILRTTDSHLGPLYWSRSTDRGKTWSDPVYFAPNGVMPRLQRLANGVTVLTSGRPGVQLRLSLDDSATEWTDPIDLVPYTKAYNNGQGTINVSSGYTRIEPCFGEENSFYLVYDTFDYTDESYQTMQSKTIWFRKITVNKL